MYRIHIFTKLDDITDYYNQFTALTFVTDTIHSKSVSSEITSPLPHLRK